VVLGLLKGAAPTTAEPGGVADSLDQAKAAFRAGLGRQLSEEADVLCST
jgi:hypothetical protein